MNSKSRMRRTVIRLAQWAFPQRMSLHGISTRLKAGLGLVAAAFLVPVELPAWAAELDAEMPQAGYTTATLREPIFDAAHVAVETVALNNWLNENYGRLKANQITGPREHLYYLIDSQVKLSFESKGQVMPKEPDLILQALFSWAERLGVYGGNLIFNRVKFPDAKAMEPVMKLPKGMELELTNDLLHVRSDRGWEVSFPYYFMISKLDDVGGTNGNPLQIMIVSTGAARDKGKLGHSQATLMMFFSPGDDETMLRTFVEPLLAFKSTDEHVKLGLNGLTSQRNFDKALLLHRELVLLQGTRGAFAVVYMGNDGTYQWNRQHFLDFLRALHTEAGTLDSAITGES